MNDLIYKEEAFQIIGACMAVHTILGPGFLESVYQEALELEFIEKNIPFEREKELEIRYKNHTLKKKFNADFVCYKKIIVELKALTNIIPEHDAQVLNYLRATGYKLGILTNFGSKRLMYKRLVL